MVVFDFAAKDNFVAQNQLKNLGLLIQRAVEEAGDLVREGVVQARFLYSKDEMPDSLDSRDNNFVNDPIAGVKITELDLRTDYRLLQWKRIRAARELLLKCLVLLQTDRLSVQIDRCIQTAGTIWDSRGSVRKRAAELHGNQWPPMGSQNPPQPPPALQEAVDVLTTGTWLRLPSMTKTAVVQLNEVEPWKFVTLGDEDEPKLKKELSITLAAELAIAKLGENDDAIGGKGYRPTCSAGRLMRPCHFRIEDGKVHIRMDGEFEIQLVNDLRKITVLQCRCLCGTKFGFRSDSYLDLAFTNTMQSATNLVADSFTQLKRKCLYGVHSWRELGKVIQELRKSVASLDEVTAWIIEEECKQPVDESAGGDGECSQQLYDKAMESLKSIAEIFQSNEFPAHVHEESKAADDTIAGDPRRLSLPESVSFKPSTAERSQQSEMDLVPPTPGSDTIDDILVDVDAPSGTELDSDYPPEESVPKNCTISGLLNLVDTRLQGFEDVAGEKFAEMKQRYWKFADSSFSFEFYRYLVWIASRFTRYLAWLMFRDQGLHLLRSGTPVRGICRVVDTKVQPKPEVLEARNLELERDEDKDWKSTFRMYFGMKKEPHFVPLSLFFENEDFPADTSKLVVTFYPLFPSGFIAKLLAASSDSVQQTAGGSHDESSEGARVASDATVPTGEAGDGSRKSGLLSSGIDLIVEFDSKSAEISVRLSLLTDVISMCQSLLVTSASTEDDCSNKLIAHVTEALLEDGSLGHFYPSEAPKDGIRPLSSVFEMVPVTSDAPGFMSEQLDLSTWLIRAGHIISVIFVACLEDELRSRVFSLPRYSSQWTIQRFNPCKSTTICDASFAIGSSLELYKMGELLLMIEVEPSSGFPFCSIQPVLKDRLIAYRHAAHQAQEAAGAEEDLIEVLIFSVKQLNAALTDGRISKLEMRLIEFVELVDHLDSSAHNGIDDTEGSSTGLKRALDIVDEHSVKKAKMQSSELRP